MRGKMKKPFRFLPFLPNFSSFSRFFLFFQIFPDFPLFFPIFVNFFAVRGSTDCPPWPPSGYATDFYVCLFFFFTKGRISLQVLTFPSKELPKFHIFPTMSGADPGTGRSGPSTTFWQLNHTNSAYFGAISANFSLILTLGPLFLQIVDLALHVTWTLIIGQYMGQMWQRPFISGHQSASKYMGTCWKRCFPLSLSPSIYLVTFSLHNPGGRGR